MKRFLFALAAVAVMLVGSSFTNIASAHGPGWGGGCGPHHSGYRGGYGYGGYGGGYGPSYSYYRPAYGPAYYPAYGGYGGYGYSSRGVVQVYGPRGGFTLGF